MSTSPDDVVQTLSRWLAGSAEVEEVLGVLADVDGLGPEASKLVGELEEELASPDLSRPQLQPLVRETIEAIALGD